MEFFLGVGLLVTALAVVVSTLTFGKETSEPTVPVDEKAGFLYKTFFPTVRRMADLGLPRLAGLESKVGRSLVAAAWNVHYSPREYVCAMYLSAIFACVFPLLFLVANPPTVLPLLPFLLILFAAVGFYLPLRKLQDAAKKRQKEIRLALPYTIDLLTVSIEAGLEFVQALSRIVGKSRPGALKDELTITLHQLNMGTPRPEALTELAERVDLDEVKSLTSLIIQSYQLGSSMGPTLRAQAEVMRTRRMQRAEKLAQEAPVKMLFPIMIFIVPCVFLIILGPLGLELWKQLSGLGK
jgi:tight adherence protein C